MANTFLNETIACFADRDGAIFLTRAHANVLMHEQGYTAKEADCVFASWWPAFHNVEPHSIDEARAIIADREQIAA
jgi:hypothetical protein